MKQPFIITILSIVFILNITLFAEGNETKPSETHPTTPIAEKNDPSLSISNTHATHTFFNSNETYKINEYIEKNDTSNGSNISKVLHVGLFDSEGELIKTLFTRHYETIDDHNIFINNVELKDLNQDSFMDIIVNVTETSSNLYKTTNSYFFINTHDDFIGLDLFFKRNTYEFQSNSVIQVTEPLYAFGTPYENDNDSKESPVWRNYYEFKGTELVQINRRFRNYYETLHRSAKRLLDKQLQNIKNYQMSEDTPDLNQLQLNEYFHQITTQKMIIKRCEDVLFTL